MASKRTPHYNCALPPNLTHPRKLYEAKMCTPGLVPPKKVYDLLFKLLLIGDSGVGKTCGVYSPDTWPATLSTR